MRRPLILGLTLIAGSIAGLAQGSPVPGEGDRRIVAPWEPVETVLVRWPPAHPGVVYQEIDQAASLTFLIASQSQQDAAIGYCSSLGIDPARLSFITTGQVSPWPRDWGPYCVFDGTGQMLIADPLWNGYPYAGQYCANPTSTFVPNNPADATANASAAAGLGLTHAPLSFYATGGNLLTDGFGRAFSSCLLVTENLKIMSESQLRADAESLMGITDWVILDNWETSGIQHIDCWAKFVDEETVLVKRPPAGHPETAPTEANVALLESLTTPWGNPYTIIRIDCPPYEPNRLANYLNSYIVNDRVLVPVFGIPADEPALQAYRDAMPGYRVVGVPHTGFYNYTDAIHCRTRSIHDPQMLRIAHPKIRNAQALNEPVEIRAFIDDRSQSGLIMDSTRLHWREAGTAQWQIVPLSAAANLDDDWYRGAIPAFGSPTAIEYFIEAADQSGRSAFMPPVGAAGPVRFAVGADALTITPLDLPSTVAPGQSPIVTIFIDQRSETLDPSTVTTHLRTAGGESFVASLMTPDGDGQFSFVLPAFVCADAPELFFSASTSEGDQRRWPAAAGSTHQITVAEPKHITLLDADFASGSFPDGFSATGLWAVDQTCPQPGSCSAVGTPSAVFTDQNSCTYDTGQRETGNLTLPALTIDPKATSAALVFCHTLHTEATDFGFLGYDIASVLINGQTVETMSDTLTPTEVSIDLSPWIGQTVTIAFRFDTVDEQYNNYPGWAIQSIRIVQDTLACTTCPADVTGDGSVNLADLNLVLANFGQSTPDGDTNGDGFVDLADLNAVLAAFGTDCP
ncbi:MAG: agmatine deiminase family protein [Phycisphaerales bacterium]